MTEYRKTKKRFLFLWRLIPIGKSITAYTFYCFFPNYFNPYQTVQWLDLIRRAKIAKGEVINEKYCYVKLK